MLKFYLAKYQKSMTRENSRVHTVREGIGSTHRGILGTYTTNIRSNYHQLESRAWLTKQRIQFTKGIIYPWKGSQGYWIWRTMSDEIQQWIRWSTTELMWVSVLNQRKKECTGIRLWFPKQGIRSRHSDQGWISWIDQRHNWRQIVWSRTSSCSEWRLSRKGNL